MNSPLENAVEKIYSQIAKTGEITDNQLILIMLYERQRPTLSLDDILKSGTKVISTVDKIMGGK